MRLDKFLSNLKYGSRKSIKESIKKRLVSVNGNIVIKEDYQINPSIDQVYFESQLVYYKENLTLAINKPKNYLSATKDNKHLVVTSLLLAPYDRFDFIIAGRLDVDSTGLLILTTDGSLAHKIKNPNNNINKTYEVILDKPFETDPSVLLNGVTIKDDWNNDYLAKAQNIIVYDKMVHITITSGKFHQVKRMFRSLDYQVLQLKRIKIGKLNLEDLELGKYKEVVEGDIL